MKRLILTLTLVFFGIFLTACQGDQLNIEVTFSEFDVTLTSVTFTAEVSDPDEQITGKLTVSLFDGSGTLKHTQDVNSADELVDYNVGSLDNSLTYTIKIYATVGRDYLVIGEKTFQLASAATVYITTPEEFMAMSNNRSGNYVLSNDIDFSGITFNTPFTSAFSGTFDGRNFKLMNITFEKISQYTGVFGYVSGGYIKDVTFENVQIGSVDTPLTFATSSRVGIVSGYVSSSTGKFENITVKDSVIHYSSSSTIQAYVGGLFGELKGSLEGATLDNVNVMLTATSYGRVRVGGAIGLLGEDAKFKNVNSNADVHVTFAGDALKDRDINVNVGGIIGFHNARNVNRSVENLFSMGDVEVTLDYGTTDTTTKGNYSLYVGGIAGIAYSNVHNALYGGSISVGHQKNANEDDVNKNFFVGGLFGFYGSNKASTYLVRYSDGATIDINVSDDVTLNASQVFGGINSSVIQNAGVHGDLSLLINMLEESGNDAVTVINSLVDYFESEFVQEAFDSLVG